MARKILNKGSPGDSTKFGSDDIDYINKYLTATDQSASDPVDVNTTTKYRSSRLQVANPANTFKTTLSSSALNADSTLNISEIYTNPEQKRQGGWVATGSNTVYFGCAAASATSIGTGTTNLSVTDGAYRSYNTGTTAEGQAGQRGDTLGAAVMRGLQGRFKAKFRISSNTNSRVYVGLHSTATAFPTGDDPLNGLSGIMLALRSSDTVFQIARNDGAAVATTFTSTGVSQNTGINTFEVRANAADTGWEWSLNGSAFTAITAAPIPASGTALYPVVVGQTTSTTSKNMDIFWWIIETSR